MAIKVLHLIHWPKSGITTLMKNVVRHQPKHSIDCAVVFLECDKPTEAEFKTTVEHVYCLRYSQSRIAAIKALKKLLCDLNPDVIHVHSLLPAILIWLLSDRRTIVLRTIHSEYPYYRNCSIRSALKRWIEKRTLSHASVVVCVAQGVKDALPWHDVLKDSVVVENGIDLQSWVNVTSKISRTELGLKDDDVVFVSLGRLEHQKGYDLLIEAFSEMRQLHEKAKLLIIGEGSQRASLENRIKQLQLESDVQLLGHQYYPQRYVSVCDVYVSSSRYEGLALSQAEAMASGLATITTLTSGIPEAIVDRQTGYLTEEISSLAIADTMIYVYEHSDERASVAMNGQKFAMKMYSVERTAHEYADLYKKLAYEK